MSEFKYSCLICGHVCKFYFSKIYDKKYSFLSSSKFDYYKCVNCGFVFSGTHRDMAPDQLELLNFKWHSEYETNESSRRNNQPPYADQALAILMLQKNGLITIDSNIDYAAGYGTLSKFFRKYLGIQINIFDLYVTCPTETYVKEKSLGVYEFVINSAMFEHITNREELERVNSLVSDTGVLMLHSVICENIPNDPNWFYLVPIVHSAFFSNKSMQILMDQWGYICSVYSPNAKSWFLFKKDCPAIIDIESTINRINSEIEMPYFFYKEGFVDYWKGF